MAGIDARGIREALLLKGVALNPPALTTTLDRLARWSGRPLHPDVVEILQEFDGFADGDFESESFVSVRPINKALSHDWTRHRRLAFADWLLDAIVFGFDPSSEGPVFDIESDRVVAPTYAEFWALLLANDLL